MREDRGEREGGRGGEQRREAVRGGDGEKIDMYTGIGMC